MDESDVFMDGTVLQSSLKNQASFRRNPEHNLTFPIEAVVIGVIYPDDKLSVSKAHIEYNLSPIFEGIPYLNNVPMAHGFGYYGDGNEDILRVASKPIKSKGTQFGDEAVCAYQNTDGDRVLVMFIQGSWTKPVIVARLPHPQNPIRAPKPDLKLPNLKNKKYGKQKTARTAIVNGTKVDIDDKGNLAITVGKHTNDSKNEVGEKKKITIFKENAETPIITINNESGSWKIDFGGDGTAAGEKLVLGNALETFLTSCADQYKDHVHDGVVVSVSGQATGTMGATSKPLNPGPGPMGVPPGVPSEFPDNHDTYQSNWITSEQDAP